MPDKSAESDADAAFYHGQLKKAVELYASAVAQDPTDRKDRLHEIDSLADQRLLDQAAAKAEAWTTASPKDAYAITAVGDVRFQRGDWLEAYALYLKALQIDPCLPDAYNGRAQFESRAGFHLTARKHFALAHQLAPNDRIERLDWILSLDQDQRLAGMQQFLDEEKSMDPKRRATLQKEFAQEQEYLEARCELIGVTGPARIPMVPMYQENGTTVYGIEIAFGGKKRTLQIDTGASGLLLSRTASAGLSLKKIRSTKVGGFGDEGANSAEASLAESVTIAGLHFSNCPVEALSRSGVLGGDATFGGKLDQIDGLIGTDLFARYLVTIDYFKHEIRLEPLPQIPGAAQTALDPLGGRNDPDWMDVDRYVAPSMASWTKIYRDGHMLVMPVRISSPTDHIGSLRMFIIDTGSDGNLIDVNVAKGFTTSQENELVRSGGLSGKISKNFETGKFTADFAGLRLPVNSMDAIDLGRFEGVSGFLGYPTLEQLVMHIDYRDNLILLEAPAAGKH